jgi:hypothetical protein
MFFHTRTRQEILFAGSTWLRSFDCVSNGVSDDTASASAACNSTAQDEQTPTPEHDDPIGIPCLRSKYHRFEPGLASMVVALAVCLSCSVIVMRSVIGNLWP